MLIKKKTELFLILLIDGFLTHLNERSIFGRLLQELGRLSH